MGSNPTPSARIDTKRPRRPKSAGLLLWLNHQTSTKGFGIRRLTALQKVSNGDGQVVLHIRQNMEIGVLRRLLTYILGGAKKNNRNLLRIYFLIDEDSKFVIGHVGEHLD